MPSELHDFIQASPRGTASALQLLATAESLTDEIAAELYGLAPLDGISGDFFVRALHYANLIVPRNSEWHFAPEFKSELATLDATDPGLVRDAHALLLEQGANCDPALAGSAIPRYLFTDAGAAYHRAELGQEDEALALYARAAEGHLSGSQWLASKLAYEQELRGILSPGAIETMFLRAMVLFREGNRQAAEPLLRKVAATDQVRKEVAIALTILGRYVEKRNPGEAERLFERSIEVDDAIGNPHGVALTLHSLARLVSRQRQRHRQKEAEELYRRSIAIGESIDNDVHVAQALHSFANHLARDPHRRAEAEANYLHSIKLSEDLGILQGTAQAMHSYANLLSRNPRRSAEAERYYKSSITLDERAGNLHGVAQTLHSFANLLAKIPGRGDEAEDYYRRSIRMEKELGRNRHDVAQKMHGLGNLIAQNPERRDEAEEMLRDSLLIGQKENDWNHEAQVLRSLSFVVEHRSPVEAKNLLERSVRINEQHRNATGARISLRSLEDLRKRYSL